MKLNREKVAGWIYGGLGLAATLAVVRFALRLLAADELNPIGKGLATAGGWVCAPFKIFFKAQNSLVLPGSSFEPQALVAAAVYGALVLALACGLAGFKLWRGRGRERPKAK